MLFFVENELDEMDQTRRDGSTSPGSFITFRNKLPAINVILRSKRTRRNEPNSSIGYGSRTRRSGLTSARWINFAEFVCYFSKQHAGGKCYFSFSKQHAGVYVIFRAKFDPLRQTHLLLFDSRNNMPAANAILRFSKQHAGGKCYLP